MLPKEINTTGAISLDSTIEMSSRGASTSKSSKLCAMRVGIRALPAGSQR